MEQLTKTEVRMLIKVLNNRDGIWSKSETLINLSRRGLVDLDPFVTTKGRFYFTITGAGITALIEGKHLLRLGN